MMHEYHVTVTITDTQTGESTTLIADRAIDVRYSDELGEVSAAFIPLANEFGHRFRVHRTTPTPP